MVSAVEQVRGVAAGAFTEIGQGVRVLSLPMQGPLRQSNSVILSDRDEIAIIDTGSDTESGRAAWTAFLANNAAAIQTILLTHGHQDHIGLAHWISSKVHISPQITPGELSQLFKRLPIGDSDDRLQTFYSAAGCPQSVAASISSRRLHYDRRLGALMPNVFETIEPCGDVTLCGTVWEKRAFGGHSPEHLALFDHHRKIIIGGDILLEHGTPFVGVDPVGIDTNPLAKYFDALHAFQAFDADWIVVPGHGSPFIGPAKRARVIEAHHYHRLEMFRNYASTPRSAYDLAKMVFPRAMDGEHAGLAIQETLAHLNFEVAEARLTVTATDEGTQLYRHS